MKNFLKMKTALKSIANLINKTAPAKTLEEANARLGLIEGLAINVVEEIEEDEAAAKKAA